MANAQVLYAESVAHTTASTTTWVDCVTLSSSSFTASKTYIIIAVAYLKGSAASANPRARLVHGTTPTEFTDALTVLENGGSSSRTCVGWLHKFDQPSTTEDIKIQVSDLATNTAQVELAQILAIKLSDDFTENTDWYYNENTADQAYTDGTTVTGATVTISADGTDRWLLIGQGSTDCGNTTQEYNNYLGLGGFGIYTLSGIEGEDTNSLHNWMMMTSEVPGSGDSDFEYWAIGSGTSHSLLSSRVFALNLSKFNQVGRDLGASGAPPQPSFSSGDPCQVLITPSSTGDFVVLANAQLDLNTVNNQNYHRLQVNASGSGLVSDPNYGDDLPNQPYNNDATEYLPQTLLNLVSLTSGAERTINYDWRRATTNSSTVEEPELIVFSVALASTGTTISPPVITNTATIYTPTVRTTKVYAPVITNTATVYTPAVKRSVAVPLIALAVTLYAPTVHTTKVNAPVITQTATVYTPAVHTTKVYAPAIEQTATIYTPAVSRKAAVPVITQTAVQYTPAVAFKVYAPAIDDTALIYTPTVSEAGAYQVEPGFIDQTAVIYTPTVHITKVYAPAITQTATLYTPAAHTTKVYVGVITQTATIYTPAVSGSVAAPLITQTATIYTPAVHTTKVYAPFIDDTAIIYTPAAAMGQTAEPPLITQTAAVYTPTVFVGTVVQTNVLSGSVDSWSTTYSVARAGTGSFSFSTAVGQYKSGSTYHCIEGFVAFDTSFLPDVPYISSVTLYLAGADFSDDNFTVRAGVATWTAGGLTTADFVPGATLFNTTTVVAALNTSLWVEGEYNALMTVPTTFADNLNTSGNTELVLFSGQHQSNVPPTGSEYVVLDWPDDDRPPVLVVAWTAGVYPPFIDNTATIYTPSVHTTKVTAPFIDQTAQVYAPTVTPLYAPPLITQTAVVYTPAVTLTVAPPLLSYGDIYTPSVAPVLYPPLITLTVQVYEPQVLFPGPLTLTVPLIDVEPILYQPQVHRFDPTQHQHRLRLRSERAGTVF